MLGTFVAQFQFLDNNVMPFNYNLVEPGMITCSTTRTTDELLPPRLHQPAAQLLVPNLTHALVLLTRMEHPRTATGVLAAAVLSLHRAEPLAMP